MNEIVLKKDNSLIAHSAVTELQNRIEAMSNFYESLMKLLRPSDFVIFGKTSKVFLTWDGASRIASLMGVEFSDIEKEKTATEDGYMYTFSGKAVLYDSNREIIREAFEFGICTSRDKFLAKRGIQYLSSIEVDEANVMKKAYAQFRRRAVSALLGIGNLNVSWFDSSFISQIQIADFVEGKYSEKEEERSDEKLKDRVNTLLWEKSQGDENEYRKILEKLTTFKGSDGKTRKGIQSLDLASQKQLQYIIQQLKKE